jgi:hypothetical protein
MPKPVITAPISPRIIAQGVAFSQTLSATNSPTSWTVSGLPSGLSMGLGAGGTTTISGVPLVQVQTTATITASNADGASDAVTIIFVVMATPPGMGGPFDIILDYELTTNEVTMPGVPQPQAGEPLFWAPRGTNRHLLIGCTYFGVLQDINPASETTTIKLGMKELETERLVEETTGATVKVADMPDDRQRYRIPFRVTPSKWTGPLSDYENDAGTQILALSEIQVIRGTESTLHDESLTDSSIAIDSGITSPTTGNHDFGSIEEFTVATPMRLTLTLNVVGRVLQTVSLVRTFDLVFSGGAFALSNLSGATTGQGAVEGGQFRATLNLTGLTGDANSVLAAYSITTTPKTYPFDFTVSPFGFTGNLEDGSAGVYFTAGPYLGLFDDTETEIGTEALNTSYAAAEEFFSDVIATWNSIEGATHALSAEATGNNSFRVWAAAATDVRYAGMETTNPVTDPYPALGEGTFCSVVGRLEQIEAPTSVPLNLTSNQFLIGVARDIVPDPA